MLGYFTNIGIGLDVTVNAMIPGGMPGETISHRIGRSILSGGWASRIDWPLSWKIHFLTVEL